MRSVLAPWPTKPDKRPIAINEGCPSFVAALAAVDHSAFADNDGTADAGDGNAE